MTPSISTEAVGDWLYAMLICARSARVERILISYDEDHSVLRAVFENENGTDIRPLHCEDCGMLKLYFWRQAEKYQGRGNRPQERVRFREELNGEYILIDVLFQKDPKEFTLELHYGDDPPSRPHAA